VVKLRKVYLIVEKLQERGIEAWGLLDEKAGIVRLGVVNKGEVRLPDRLLEKADDLFNAILLWASGQLPGISSETQITPGPGTFPDDAWSERERSWLRFQAWLVVRGHYQEDLTPTEETLDLA